MQALRKFEIDVIKMLCGSTLDAALLHSIVNLQSIDKYEYTGSGYFLTLLHSALDIGERIFDFPFVIGRYGIIQCGFVGFLRPGEFVLECHTWGPVDVPEDFRDMDVVLSVEDVNVVHLDVGAV